MILLRKIKLKALEAAKLQIEKQFGKGSIMKLGSGVDLMEIDVIPSGSICSMKHWV